MSRVNKKAKRRQVLDVESVADSKDEGPVVDAEAASAQSDASEVALELPAKKKKRKKKPLPASADPSGHSEVEPTDNDDDKAAAVAVVVTEEELGLVGKKKKKKKKIPSVAMGEDLVSVAAAPPALPLKRKKSKPKATIESEPTADESPTSLDEAKEGDCKEEEEEKTGESLEDTEDQTAEADFALSLIGKKKRKRVVGAGETKVEHKVEVDENRDYTYMELLSRVFDQIRAKRPNAGSEPKRKLPPPDTRRVGSKKTLWANFAQTCVLMHRPEEHVQLFVLSELATTGSLDAQHRLVLRGKYLAKQIEALLTKYIAEFVVCHVCKCTDTQLTRDPVTRLYFVQCGKCEARRSVTTIRSGFHATTKGDRRKIKFAQQ